MAQLKSLLIENPVVFCDGMGQKSRLQAGMGVHRASKLDFQRGAAERKRVCRRYAANSPPAEQLTPPRPQMEGELRGRRSFGQQSRVPWAREESHQLCVCGLLGTRAV